MKLKFLGTGTSQGVPPIGCTHPVCKSSDPRDKRLRTSAIVTTDDGRKILIDCGPDFRQQMLATGEEDVHAVLLTHEHNDHVIGLDDLRPLIFKNRQDMPLYCNERVAGEVMTRFPYAFGDERYPGAPGFEIYIVKNPFSLFGEAIIPVEIKHYQLDIFGYRIRNMAYITDGSFLSDNAMKQLQNLEILVINCLRLENPHHAHFILPDILEIVSVLKPAQTYLTHMSHHMGFHEELLNKLPAGISPSYDSLEVEF